MSNIYFASLLVGLFLTLAYTLVKPEKFYEYPYFMAAVFIVFIVPQCVSILRFPGMAVGDPVENVLLMSCLCFGCCWLGYLPRPWRLVSAKLACPIDQDRLFQGGLIFMAVSFFFNYLISRMSDEETGGSQWTGPVTIYGFFAGLIYPAFAICLSTALRKQTAFAWLSVAIASIQPILSAFIAGRRETTVLCVLTVALTLFYTYGLRPARLVILGFILFATLAIPATGTYRGFAAERDWEGVRQMDLIGNFRTFLNTESVLELRNAALLIQSVKESGDYEYGGGYWDAMVFRFVPAQILGKKFKEGIMFEPPEERAERETARMAYNIPLGATLTGMGDSFVQFGFFGCLFFAALGFLFKSFYAATRQRNAIFAQLFYIMIGTSAMRAVTHETVDFLPGMTYYAIFLGILFWYVKLPLYRSRRLLPFHTRAPLSPETAAEAAEETEAKLH